jgi:hypothetical protein
MDDYIDPANLDVRQSLHGHYAFSRGAVVARGELPDGRQAYVAVAPRPGGGPWSSHLPVVVARRLLAAEFAAGRWVVRGGSAADYEPTLLAVADIPELADPGEG